MIVLLVYFLVVIICIYPFSRLVLDTYPGDKPDSFDRGIGIFLGALLSVFWPMFLVVWVAWKVSKRIWSGILGPEKSKEKVNR